MKTTDQSQKISTLLIPTLRITPSDVSSLLHNSSSQVEKMRCQVFHQIDFSSQVIQALMTRYYSDFRICGYEDSLQELRRILDERRA